MPKLTLMRNRGQVIMIGDEISVTVKHIRTHAKGTTVHLTIEAPGDVPIKRLEIWKVPMGQRRGSRRAH